MLDFFLMLGEYAGNKWPPEAMPGGKGQRSAYE
jgi:hypothetical protein